MNDSLLKDAQLGIEAEAFLSSELGKFLLDKANAELDQANAEWIKLLPSQTNELLKLQMQATRAIEFKQWLIEAISTGHYAESELKNE